MFTCYQSSEVAWEGSLLKTRESVDSYTKTNIYKYVEDLVKLQQASSEAQRKLGILHKRKKTLSSFGKDDNNNRNMSLNHTLTH